MQGLHALHAISRVHGLHPYLLLVMLLGEADSCTNQIPLCGVRESGLHNLLTISCLHTGLLMLRHQYLMN